MPRSADFFLLPLRLRVLSELHLGHSMSLHTNLHICDSSRLSSLSFLHFLAPTALQLPLYVALAMLLCCYKYVYVM